MVEEIDDPPPDEPERPRVDPAKYFDLAERVLEVLERHEIGALVIGGFALAVHNYPRTTFDLDLGVAASLAELERLRDEFIGAGFSVELRPPDGNDPLGGVLDIVDGPVLVQVVNFDNRPANGFPAVVKDALAASSAPAEGSRLRTVPLPHLIAMKLYAGGAKSMADIKALLEGNPGVDREPIRALCRQYRLKYPAGLI